MTDKSRNAEQDSASAESDGTELNISVEEDSRAEAADALAERIRALGKLAPTGFQAFRDLTIIKHDAQHRSTPEMIAELVADNEAVARRMSEFAELAEDAGGTRRPVVCDRPSDARLDAATGDLSCVVVPLPD